VLLVQELENLIIKNVFVLQLILNHKKKTNAYNVISLAENVMEMDHLTVFPAKVNI